MCHEGAEYLSGEYRGEPELESEKVFKPHSEDCEIIGFVYPIYYFRDNHTDIPFNRGRIVFTRPSILGSGCPTVSERASREPREKL